MSSQFIWPHGKRAALSLSFDDARLSQMDRGIPLLDKHGVKATFYVTVNSMHRRLDGWKRAVANGHEVGNHTLTHPCSGNFGWSQDAALENYTLARMEADIAKSNEEIQQSLGVKTTTFAFPCGQKFVGRGEKTHSYVPLIAQHFVAGRGFRDESTNDPMFCDLAQLCGQDSDDQPFEQLKPWLDDAVKNGRWTIFVSHEVGDTVCQAMLPEVLETICRYAKDPANGIWIDTVANLAMHVRATRRALGVTI